MLITQLNALEKSVIDGTWNPKSGELWRGAGVIVAASLSDELFEWESDSDDSLGVYEPDRVINVLLISQHAAEISSLFYELKEIFNGYINYANKYTFYGRLGYRAKIQLDQHDDIRVLLEMIEEAKDMAHQLEGSLYFAYGADMGEQPMSDCCPTAKLLGKVRLDGYRFLINSHGEATIAPDKEHFVEGLLWSVFPKDEAILHDLGNISGYSKAEVTVSSLHFVDYDSSYLYQETEATTYISEDKTPGGARPDYIKSIILPANAHDFDRDYIDELIGWLK